MSFRKSLGPATGYDGWVWALDRPMGWAPWTLDCDRARLHSGARTCTSSHRRRCETKIRVAIRNPNDHAMDRTGFRWHDGVRAAGASGNEHTETSGRREHAERVAKRERETRHDRRRRPLDRKPRRDRALARWRLGGGGDPTVAPRGRALPAHATRRRRSRRHLVGIDVEWRAAAPHRRRRRRERLLAAELVARRRAARDAVEPRRRQRAFVGVDPAHRGAPSAPWIRGSTSAPRSARGAASFGYVWIDDATILAALVDPNYRPYDFVGDHESMIVAPGAWKKMEAGREPSVSALSSGKGRRRGRSRRL